MTKSMINPYNILDPYLTALTRFSILFGSFFVLATLTGLSNYNEKMNEVPIVILLTAILLVLTKSPSFTQPKVPAMMLLTLALVVCTDLARIYAATFNTEAISAAYVLFWIAFLMSIVRAVTIIEFKLIVALFTSSLLFLFGGPIVEPTLGITRESFHLLSGGTLSLTLYVSLALLILSTFTVILDQVKESKPLVTASNSMVTTILVVLASIIFTAVAPNTAADSLSEQVGVYALLALTIPTLIIFCSVAINIIKLTLTIFEIFHSRLKQPTPKNQ